MRDFTYIDDVIDGIISAMNRCDGFNIYNLGESQPVSVNDLITEIEKVLARSLISKVRILPRRKR